MRLKAVGDPDIRVLRDEGHFLWFKQLRYWAPSKNVRALWLITTDRQNGDTIVQGFEIRQVTSPKPADPVDDTS